jgi:hypothetical protein
VETAGRPTGRGIGLVFGHAVGLAVGKDWKKGRVRILFFEGII